LNGKAGQNVGSPNVETSPRLPVSANGTSSSTATASPKVLRDGDLTLLIEGKESFNIPASAATSDTKSNTFASSSSAAASAIAIAAAINSKTGDTGVIAIANGATITGSKTTVNANAVQTDLYVNGTQINLSLTSGQTESARRQYVMNSINAKTSLHGVVAGDSGNGGLTLTTNDGRNLSVWYDASKAIGSDFGLGENKPTTSDPAGVTGVATAAAAAITNKTIESLSTSTTSKDIAISSTVGLVVGMAVSGAGIPSGATITSVTASSITLSAFPTAAATNATALTFTGGVKASTVYGTVDLNSAKEFNIVAGQNASPTDKTTTTSNQFKFTGQAAATVGFSYNGKSGTYTSDSSSPTTAANFATAVNTLAGTTVAYTASSHAGKVASAASGVTSLTVSDPSGLVPGMKLTGPGIAGSTTISSISGSTLTINPATSGSVGSQTSFEYPAGADTVYIPSSSGVSFTAPSAAYKPAMSLVTGTDGFTSTTQVVAVDPNNSNISALGFIPGAVNAKNIGLIKKGAVIVNCARGEILELSALVDALKSGHLLAYAADVLDQEPPPADHPPPPAPPVRIASSGIQSPKQTPTQSRRKTGG
jgi:hypothetical protein